MEAIDPRKRLARRAYESGRLRSALRVGLYVLPMVALGVAGCGAWSTTCALGAALYLVAAGLLWRGEAWGEGVGAGLIAGAAPLALPIMVHKVEGWAVGVSCSSLCFAGCVLGGALAGGLLAWRATRRPRPYLFGAALVAALAGSLGCLAVGLSGVIGMVAAIAVASAPALLARRAA